jgi:hypothetical protein
MQLVSCHSIHNRCSKRSYFCTDHSRKCDRVKHCSPAANCGFCAVGRVLKKAQKDKEVT